MLDSYRRYLRREFIFPVVCRENASYLFVFLFMMIESSFIPFPSEVVVLPAAYLACCKLRSSGADMNVYYGGGGGYALALLAGAFVNYFLALWSAVP